MRENIPSRTALRVAMHRAAHQVMDDPRIFDDPVSLSILGTGDASPAQGGVSWLEHEKDPASVKIRAFVAARSRYAEDRLHEAMQGSVRQYVVLGAGLDTWACRHSTAADGVRVFEVDHPATQAWKRTLLEQAGIPVPAALAFVPIDFETVTLREGLERAGFDTSAPAFFSWLGVTQYIRKDAVEETLAYVASLPAGTSIVFDYTMDPSLMSPAMRQAYDWLAQRVASVGEPFLTSFSPSLLKDFLMGLGFTRITDLGPGDVNALYFQGRADGLQTGGFTRLLHARR